jgi:hypothetical protein
MGSARCGAPRPMPCLPDAAHTIAIKIGIDIEINF